VAVSAPEPSPEADRSGEAASEAAHGRRLRLLFFLHTINYDRHFEDVLRELLGRGHVVHVAFEIDRLGRGGDSTLFESFRLGHPGRFSYGVAPRRKSEVWAIVSRRLRLGIDYLRFLEPGFKSATAARARAKRRARRAVPFLAGLPLLRGSGGRRLLDRVLRAFDRATPIDSAVVDFVAQFRPDAVLISPLVNLGSLQEDYVRCARALRVPSAVLVASWDNLTNKGLIRDCPDLVLVWNEVQRGEAIQLHGVPPERVVATGAHTYDHWFEWRPRTARGEFCGRVGLDPERPFLLYVCSSRFIAPDEAPFIARWIEFLRGSSVAELRAVGVLVRPHPANHDTWERHDVTEPGRVAVFPAGGAKPTQADVKADYFDSLYHAAAVVGLNTSALIEAGIVGRPVLSLVVDENREGQTGTLHFSHIASEGSLLRVARDWDEHERQLAEALASPVSPEREFLRSFIRPRGLDQPAAPLLVDSLERLADGAVPSVASAWRRLSVRMAVAAVAFPLVWAKRSWRAATDVLLPPAIRAKTKRVRRSLKAGRAKVRARVKAIRRFFTVWLRAAARVRVGRLRRRFKAVLARLRPPRGR
jgi:hypothetical protein